MGRGLSNRLRTDGEGSGRAPDSAGVPGSAFSVKDCVEGNELEKWEKWWQQ